MKKTRKRHPTPVKGGAVDPEGIYVFGTMLVYGIVSIFVGPMYLLAELINTPVSSINKFSRKAFQNQDSHLFHRPLYQILAMYRKPNLDKEEFLLQEDTHIHKRVALVALDKDPEPKKDASGKIIEPGPSEIKSITPPFTETMLQSMGILRNTRPGSELKNLVFRLFDYIEQLPKTDVERKSDINLLVYQMDFKTLVKCYLISKTVSAEACAKVKSQKKTILRGEDVVTIVNPFYHPCNPSYTKRLFCLKRHMTTLKFKQENEDLDCKVTCDSCTFLNSAYKLGSKFISSGAWIVVLSMMVSGVLSIPAVISATGLSTVYATSTAAAASASSSTAGKAAAAKVVAPGIKYAFDQILKGLALYVLYPNDYKGIASNMLAVYYKHIKITNEEAMKKQIELFDVDWKLIIRGEKKNDQEQVKIFKITTGYGRIANSIIGIGVDSNIKEKHVNTNILQLLDKIQVKADLTNAILADKKVDGKYPNDQDREEVIGRLNSFLCKYDILDTVKSRIAKKFVEKNKPAEYTLRFIFDDAKKDE